MLKPGLIIAVVVIVLDQLTKVWAETALAGRLVEVFSWFNLRLAYNRGAAFSLLGEAGGWQRWLFIGVGGVIVIILVGWLRRLDSGQRAQGLALALLLGGAIGNLIDRVLYGHVIDFIDWHYAGWHWPTFNIADSAISVGVALMLVSLVFGERRAEGEHGVNIDYEIQPGCRVRLHLRIRLTSGTVVEDSFAAEPFEFVMGDGSLNPNLELAIYGLRPGKEQTLTLAPEQAFGLHDPELVQEVPAADFPAGIALEPGLIIGFDTPEGEEIPGAVLAVGERMVQVDFNHPLAGKPIIFETRILDVEPPTAEKGEA